MDELLTGDLYRFEDMSDAEWGDLESYFARLSALAAALEQETERIRRDAGLGVVMAVEKWLPWGRRLAVPLGVALLIWAALLLLGGMDPAAHSHHH